MEQAIFWDFDGTLVYSHKLWTTAVFEVMQEQTPGHGVAFDALREDMRQGYPWDRHDEDLSAVKGEAFWDFMRQHFETVYQKHGLAPEEARRLAPLVRQKILDPTRYFLYEDTHEILQYALSRGWKNYILSNNYPELEETMEKLGIARYFSGAVVSGKIGLDKPRPEIFHYALRLAGNPRRCMMVGDNPVADIEGARAVGIPTVMVHRQAENTADHWFARLREIEPLLD